MSRVASRLVFCAAVAASAAFASWASADEAGADFQIDPVFSEVLAKSKEASKPVFIDFSSEH